MADLTFGLLALPENIKSLIKIGTWIHNCLKTSQNAPETLQRLESLGSDIYGGQLNLQLATLQQLLIVEKNDTYLNIAIKHVERLCSVSSELKVKLQNCTDDTGTIRKFHLGFIAEKDIENTLGRYSRALADLQAFMLNIYIQRQSKSTLTDGLHLTKTRLVVFSKYETDSQYHLDHSGYVRRAEGELKQRPDMLFEEVFLLLESQLFERESVDSKAPQPVEELAQKMWTAFYPKAAGVLPCLGYRTEPRTDLVFRIPDSLSKMHVESLQSVIAHKNQGRGMPIKQRLHIAYGIAAAIESVHCSKLIHKSLRPETVLLFSDVDAKNQEQYLGHTFHPYLSSWSFIRSYDDLSSRSGTHDWTENLYRHPERHDVHVEHRYTPGHDIYSLGVTLLELGLWDPLITWSSQKPRLSTTYLKAAAEIKVVQNDDYDSNFETLTHPINTRDIIVHLVSKLESEMGSVGARYADLVNTCLTWVEAGNERRSVSKDPVEGAFLFQEKVAGPLLDLRLSF